MVLAEREAASLIPGHSAHLIDYRDMPAIPTTYHIKPYVELLVLVLSVFFSF